MKDNKWKALYYLGSNCLVGSRQNSSLGRIGNNKDRLQEHGSSQWNQKSGSKFVYLFIFFFKVIHGFIYSLPVGCNLLHHSFTLFLHYSSIWPQMSDNCQPAL